MVETLHPGIYFIEEPGQPVVPGVGVSEAGFIGVAERGPDDASPILASFSQFVRWYGSFYQGNYLAYAVKAFFENGGTRCRVIRAIQPGVGGTLQTGLVGSNNAIVWTTVYDGPAFLKLNNPGASASLGLRFDGTTMIVDLATDAGATATVNTGTPATDQITWTAQAVGSGGNSITIALVDPSANNSPLSISVVGTAISVSLATNAGGTIISTAPQVVDAITNITNPAYSLAAAALVTASTADAGVCAAVGATPLASGVDPAVTSTANDVVTLVSGHWRAKLLISAAHATGSAGTGVVDALAATQLTGSQGGVVGRTQVMDLAGAIAFPLEALYKGAYGNGLSYTTLRASTVTTADLNNGDTSVTVASVTPFRLGDILTITDGTTSVQVFLTGISAATKTLSFRATVPGATIASGSSVMTSSSNRVSTKTTAALSDGDTSVAVVSTKSVKIGQRMIFDDGTTWVEVLVTGISGKNVQFDAVTLGATIASGAVAASVEFELKVIEKEEIREVYRGLSMESGCADYFLTRLFDDSNESTYVQIPSDTATSPGYLRLPAPVTSPQFLYFGDDGDAPTSTDIIGTDVVPRTGMYQIKDNPTINFFCAPGFTTVAVEQAMIALCEELGDIECILSCPLADDLPDEALEFRNIELNADTSRAALYYPWLKITDPEDAKLILQQPQDGWMAAVWSRVARDRGVHKAPANELIQNVRGLTYDLADAEHDLLNPAGINATISRPGRGIRIMGARTLQSVTDDLTYIGTRRTLDYIRRSLKQSLGFALFEPNDATLWDRLETAVGGFLFRLWQSGALVPVDNPALAYYVKSDEETNPRARQLLGEVHVEVGVAVTLPGEFLVIHLRRIEGETTVEEV